MGGAVVSGVAEGSAIVDASGLPSWVATLGTLGTSALIGGVVVAVVNHYFTTRRERGAWLRELQIEASREFYAAAQDIVKYTVTDNAAEPLVDPNPPPGGAPDAIAKRAVVLTQKHMALIPVAEQRTVDMGTVVVNTLPCLAYQAVPLPGTAHLAALLQRDEALTEIAHLMVDLTMVIRQDVGLSGWRERWQARRERKHATYSAMTASVVDRPGKHPAPAKLLWSWEVADLEGKGIPDDLAGYHVDQIPMTHPKGFVPQACAHKRVDGNWRFGMMPGLAAETEEQILEDVVRLITGHHNAFPLRHSGHWLALPDGGRGYVWPRATT
jgi:hypothetical protein